MFPHGEEELEGVANRTDFDLGSHTKNQNDFKIPFKIDNVQIDRIGDLKLSRKTLIQISGSNIDKNNFFLRV